MMGREYLPSSRSSQKPFAFVYCGRGAKDVSGTVSGEEEKKGNGSHLLTRGSDSHRVFGNIGLRGSVGRLDLS